MWYSNRLSCELVYTFIESYYWTFAKYYSARGKKSKISIFLCFSGVMKRVDNLRLRKKFANQIQTMKTATTDSNIHVIESKNLAMFQHFLFYIYTNWILVSLFSCLEKISAKYILILRLTGYFYKAIHWAFDLSSKHDIA